MKSLEYLQVLCDRLGLDELEAQVQEVTGD